MKTCPQCNKSFEASGKQKYCSLSCRDQFNNGNRKAICKNCGKEFRGTKRLYCSDLCRGKSLGTVGGIPISPTCACCGKSHTRKSPYCSKSCYAKATRTSIVTHSGKCEYCGKHYKSGGKRFCDKSCSAKYRVHVLGIVSGAMNR